MQGYHACLIPNPTIKQISMVTSDQAGTCRANIMGLISHGSNYGAETSQKDQAASNAQNQRVTGMHRLICAVLNNKHI